MTKSVLKRLSLAKRYIEDAIKNIENNGNCIQTIKFSQQVQNQLHKISCLIRNHYVKQIVLGLNSKNHADFSIQEIMKGFRRA